MAFFQELKEKFEIYRSRGLIVPGVFVLFLASFLTVTLVANSLRRSLFSEAQFSSETLAPTRTPTPIPFCKDGTPAEECCKSGHRCVDTAGVYLCIGGSCGATS